MKISSQRYTDEIIVAEKIANKDFTAYYTRIETADGEIYEIVIDGHHSIAAAKEVGAEIEWVESDYNYQKECDHLGFDNFMAEMWIDSDWYDVETGENIW